VKIVKTSADDKYWVVRPGTNYTFGKHFFDNGVIAIGHMDCVDVEEEGTVSSEQLPIIEASIRRYWQSDENSLENAADSEITSLEIKTGLDDLSESSEVVESLQNSNERSASSIAKDVNMTKTFISDIGIGDTVISPFKEHVLIGTIVSSPYIDSEPVLAFTKDGKEQLKSKLKYKLRRRVKWDKIEPKKTMPWMIQKSLSSAQAVYSLNHHRELLEHWLYSVFMSEEGLHFSTFISKQTDISQFHIAEFQRFIQKLELTAAYIVDNNISLEGDFAEQLENAYFEYGNTGNFTLTTKQSFTSPGNIWSQINGPELRQKVFALLLLQSFGVYGANNSIDDDVQPFVDTITKVAQSLSTTENFESHKKHIGADIDKVRKTKIDTEDLVTEDQKSNKVMAAFPSMKEQTEVGI
tara:strand:+ start:1039 stop:2268 length:1230 start_codon:yes stop_codon:yes gene_type:complete